MEVLFTFLINASIGIGLFYMVYWLFLRKETFYSANRFFLIGVLLISIFLPFFPIQYSVIVESQNNTPVFKTIADTFHNIPVVSGTEAEATNFNWQQGILLVYLTGAAIFLLRLLSQTFILIHLMIKYRIKSLDGVRIIENEKYGLPFSFFNVIFINPKFHTQDELPEILAHEKVHIRENHWFDLLFIELLTVIFWFNPFIWFFERSIKQNHEYLADKGVVSEGHNLGRYQAILLNQLMGMQIIGITNNLNFALNTNRLKMMTKKKTSVRGRTKFVWTLPVLALLLFAFAEPEYRTKVTSSTEKIRSKQEVEWNNSVKIKGLVLDKDGDPLPGTTVLIKGSTIGTVCDIDGTFELEVPENASIELSFVGKETVVETYQGIKKGTNKDGIFHQKFKMKDEVIYASACFDMPPPPPPPKPKNEKLSPPPPPPPADGEQEVFFIVESMPEFPGGSYALTKYVQNLTEKYDLKGKAKIGFTVNAKGSVTKIKIIESDSEKIGKAAAEIIGKLPKWKSGSQRGKPVPVKYLIAVEFR